ncbi:DUF47 family protein [Candidatus Bathyarchaeota archaeon]|nr:DUF47 family protein [Candidatus Bathyarchaeota archaeon]
MVFPIESEDRTMRNLLMLCQDHARLIVEAYRKVLAITDNLINEEKKASGFMEDINSIVNESIDIRGTLIRELHEIGGVLVSREDFFRLISKFGDIVDHINSIGARFAEMEKRNWLVSEDIASQLNSLNDKAFDTLIKLREAVMSLGFNSEKSIGFTKEIDNLEKIIDQEYMRTEMTVITSDLDLPIILILKDNISMIESLVDSVRDASDLIRIIAL